MPKSNEKHSPVGSFFSRIKKSVSSPKKDVHSSNSNGKENEFAFKCPEAPPPRNSSPSRFGTLVNRISGRKPKAAPLDPDAEPSPNRAKSANRVAFSSPRPAVSENDLRHVTLTRGSDMPVTPLVGAVQFISEDNLASADCGTPARRVPSYVKISCSLNGYSQSPRSAVMSPARAAMGQSLVERRLMQYRDFNESVYVHSPAASRIPYSTSSPYEMGNNISTPTPIKHLINQFDKLNLCTSDEKGSCDKEKTHRIVINQPNFDDSPKKSELSTSTVDTKENIEKLSDIINGTEPGPSVESQDKTQENEEKVVEDTASSTKVNQPVVASVGSARDGETFSTVLETVKEDLNKKIKEAEADLENVEQLSDDAASCLRIASGKASLLIRKKLGKFSELVHKNMNPIADDPQPATADDLEGYWGLVEIELSDISKCFEEVEKWRQNNWKSNGEEDKKEEKPTITNNNNVTNFKKKEPTAPAGPKPKTEKQVAAEVARKKQMAAARAKMAAARKAEEAAGVPSITTIS